MNVLPLGSYNFLIGMDWSTPKNVTEVLALKVWRHYLIRKMFLLKTDNIGLKYLFDQQNINAHQVRLLVFLSDYGFEVKSI